jgi:hypothetical protein
MNPGDSNQLRKSRRRLIQVLATGGAVVTANSVPKQWARPVVDAVTLPAHAQTSGEITLGNNGNVFVINTQDQEQAEAMLASGNTSSWGEVLDLFVAEAEAGLQDDFQVLCTFAGCFSIKYQRGENSGKFYASVIDNLADNNTGAYDLVLDFTDGQWLPFDEPCLLDREFRVDLVNDEVAWLRIKLGEKMNTRIRLVRDFVCEPAEDTIFEDGNV